MCSRDEGVPLSILEAMQFGLPIFSTNVGGIPDIVSSNGTLFEPTEEAIRRAIQEITEGVYDLNDMSGKSLQLYAEKYSLDFMVEKYISVIKAIVNE